MILYQTERFVVYDLEVYKNYFLAGFMEPGGHCMQVESAEELAEYLVDITKQGFELVGFNSKRYDDPVMTKFLETGSTHAAYLASKAIVHENAKPWNYDSRYVSVDLMPLLPGRMSLKQIGIRLHHKKLQELPIHWDSELSEKDKDTIRKYNINDLQITKKLLDHLLPEIELRADLSREYGIDLRSLGDATIAEKVITSEIVRMGGGDFQGIKELAKLNRTDVYVRPPTWWHELGQEEGTNVSYIFWNQMDRFDRKIPLDENGRLKMPKESPVYLGDKWYRIGVGGLHSIDGPGSYKAPDGGFLVDIDVASYYPAILLTQKRFPRHLEQTFGVVYQKIVDMRLAAKKSGDKVTADRLKITINGTFGKTSDPYSSLYDPQVTASTTIIGQVALLLLIADLTDKGLEVVSANTDGVTVRGFDRAQLEDCVTCWEQLTGFDMEYTDYDAIYYRDVNNYLAVLAGGKGTKGKGIFATKKDGVDLRHSLRGNIIAESVTVSLTTNLSVCPLQHMIACDDINKFLITHAATGGYTCSWWGEEIGKLVRFYKADDSIPREPIRKTHPEKKTTNVPLSEGCELLMDLPTVFPKNIDYEWYWNQAKDLLKTVSHPKSTGLNAEAKRLMDLGLTPAVVNADPMEKGSRGWSHYGETDFNSINEDQALGVCTGPKAGIVAFVTASTGETRALCQFDGKLPHRTRPLIAKNYNTHIIYGARVHVPRYFQGALLNVEPGYLEMIKETYYTPSEIARAEAKL